MKVEELRIGNYVKNGLGDGYNFKKSDKKFEK